MQHSSRQEASQHHSLRSSCSAMVQSEKCCPSAKADTSQAESSNTIMFVRRTNLVNVHDDTNGWQAAFPLWLHLHIRDTCNSLGGLDAGPPCLRTATSEPPTATDAWELQVVAFSALTNIIKSEEQLACHVHPESFTASVDKPYYRNMQAFHAS